MSRPKTRGSLLSSRPFYTAVFFISCFAALSFLRSTLYRHHEPISSEAAILKRSKKLGCDQVHLADDQCSFVKEHCLDEDAGLVPYLELYFCASRHVKPVAFVILVVWLGLLFTTIGIAASDFFSINLGTIAGVLGLSESLAGVTFLAFGNGSPDVFSTFAAMGSNSASMAIGELIGAAGFITGVVAGSMALVREFRVDRKTYARDICFFIVAVCFTMVFLVDGQLQLWECSLMIGYYVIYVATVVFLHWRTTRRKARRKREGEARSHVYGLVGAMGDELAGEPYRDDPDDSEQEPGVTPGTLHSGGDNSAVFEQGPRIEIDGQHTIMEEVEDDMDDEDHRMMVAAEVTSSMRVLRSRSRRAPPKTPIRPSLVGALEFRSALAQLQRESNLQLSSMPSDGRSNSEAILSRRDTISVNYPAEGSRARHTLPAPEGISKRRNRALSANDVFSSQSSEGNVWDSALPATRRPSVEDGSLGLSQQTQRVSRTIGGNLAPPILDTGLPTAAPRSDVEVGIPKLHLQIPSRRSSCSDGSSDAGSPFPRFSDSPMPMTPNDNPGGVAPREAPLLGLQVPAEEPKPVRWWPYQILPPPHRLLSTLFPTLAGWREKSIWDKFVSAVSVPSIFLLVITLPVVEQDANADSVDAETVVDAASVRSLPQPVAAGSLHGPGESEWERYRRHTIQRKPSQSSDTRSLRQGVFEHEETLIPTDDHIAAVRAISETAKPASDAVSDSHINDESLSWNRWLLCLQLLTGPLFAVFVLWAHLSGEWDDPYKDLVRMILCTLVCSLVLLATLLLTTSEHKRPKYHYLFCYLGFVIAIAWISTIAEEVVGVLKTFGVVLGISEALLGLTIFAAGNSVGDLVADITVARLGYPVMALSACFGGPMLNILLGIGIGGVLMMVQKASHDRAKHPDRAVTYEPYHVQVGGTLLISAITLLITLVGMLVIVPLNKWILSRRIGYGLIVLWAVSTCVNVVVEVTGVWGELS